VSSQEFTAKDFRTWAGTVLACMMLREFEAFESETQAKKNVVEAIKAVAQRLGNTPSVCRKCYVHPAVLECYMTGALANGRKPRTEKVCDEAADALREEEAALMRLLRQRLKNVD
jgi:DNA topoisomerase-1